MHARPQECMLPLRWSLDETRIVHAWPWKCVLLWHRITFETRSVRDASTVATPATRDATASAAHIAIGKTHVPMHMSKERFGATSLFASALAKSGGLAETSKLGEQIGQCHGGPA